MEVEDKEVDTLEEADDKDEEGNIDVDEIDVEKFEIAKDAIGVKYMEMERSVCFLENMVFTVEVPVSEHNRPKVNDAKVKDIKILKIIIPFRWLRMLDKTRLEVTEL